MFSEMSCFNVGAAPGVVGVFGVAPRLVTPTEEVVGGVFAGARDAVDAECDADDGDFSAVWWVPVGVVADDDVAEARFDAALGVTAVIDDAPAAEGVETLLIT